MPLNDLDDFTSNVIDEAAYPYASFFEQQGGRYEIGDVSYFEQQGQRREIGASEIGDISYFEQRGQRFEIGASEIGDISYFEQRGQRFEIGAEEAVLKVIEKARDNRQPAPRMRAVDVDAPFRDDDDWGLTDTFIGEAQETGNPDPFPITSALLLRFGAGGEPRLVRIDTEESYKAFRAETSPEMATLRERVDELTKRLAAHETDPDAHAAIADDIEDLTLLGEEVKDAEAEKRVELWLPKRFDGLVTAWREGDFVCASIALPGSDGEIRVCTSLEPIRKCVMEMSRHAAEANVPAATVVGVLPAMGTVLGAGTAIKEMAAAAPAILKRPEAADKKPFMVRIEPKANPALCALAALASMCRAGDEKACDEWQRLSALAGSGPVKQAMGEALALVKAAA